MEVHAVRQKSNSGSTKQILIGDFHDDEIFFRSGLYPFFRIFSTPVTMHR